MKWLTFLFVASVAVVASAQQNDSLSATPESTKVEYRAEDEAYQSPEKNAEEGTTYRKKKTVVTVKASSTDSGFVVVKEARDTVYVVNTKDFKEAFDRGEIHLESFRKKGYGLGGGPTPGFSAINMDPIKELIRGGYPIEGRSYDFGEFDYSLFRMHGGMGYLGVGNGIRLGGGGMNGERKISSDKFNGNNAVVLNVKVGYGGFLVEKAGTKGKLNYVAGGFLGGGNFEVSSDIVRTDSLTAFAGLAESIDDETIDADFFSLEVHGGITYTILPFFHMGVDLSVPFFISSTGFTPYTDDFATVNPGLRFRIMFGNLG